MKQIFSNTLLLLALILVLPSCSDWMDLSPKDKPTDKMVWEKAEYVDLYVNGFYTYFHHYGQFGSQQFSGSLTESLTDTYKYGSVALDNKAGHPNNYVTNPDAITSAGCLYGNWNDAYNRIRRLNEFLATMEKYSNFTPEENARWEAQIRFFRAFIYDQLARRYGGAIIYTSLDQMKKDKAKSTEKEVWDLVESDLDFAFNNLPEEWTSNKDKGRLTKAMVAAYKSRAMLFAERWQSAYDAADYVISSGKYALVDNYANAWKGGNKEAIIEYKYDLNGPTHIFDRDHVPMCDGFEFGSLGTPTQEMVEEYEMADGSKLDWAPYHTDAATRPPYEKLEPRFHATIIFPGSVWKGKTMENSVGGKNGSFMEYKSKPYSFGMTTTGYFLRKLLDENHLDLNGIMSTQSWVELRYAEVLLNKAEAAIQLQKAVEARSLINQVRARVQLPPTNASGKQLMDVYRHERKVELAYEGHLFWDMRRWKLAHIAYDNYRCHGFKITGDRYEYVDVDFADRKFPERLYLLPIPASEFKNNSLIEQNPNWN